MPKYTMPAIDKYGQWPADLRAKLRESLIINLSNSECGNCGRQVLPVGDSCEHLSGYGPQNGTPGCGAKWKYVTSAYMGERVEAAVKRSRPDLEFWNMVAKLNTAVTEEANGT